MNTLEQIELTKAYVALSNAHRLEFILPLFAEQALYHSTFVGEFTGRSAIHSMMTDFFARFPDVYWTVTEYRSVDESTVEFAFTMTATAAATGQAGVALQVMKRAMAFINRFGH
ncbi:MAG TPA: nuclear transport factor 2 family protein, partial [Candidatus Competibacteraceae bacterium]|nr:nuclear transport factor 2 family protein [Candidatus Competibacteraceae bacterium]